MDKLGFIGFGSMGSMLIKGFIKSGQIKMEQIIVTRKDKGKLDEITNIWPKICTVQTASEVAQKAKYIFICVKPLEHRNVLEELKLHISLNQHIIFMTDSLTINNIEKMVNCKITKIMPTIVSEVGEGIVLVCHNNKVTDEDAYYIESLIGTISSPRRIDEKDFEFATELTSCGPGLIAAIFQEFAESGLRYTDQFKEEDIVEMILQTLYGTAKLMLKTNMSFENVISRVATKGGITEEGVNVIKKRFPQIFDEMFDNMMNKHKEVSKKMISEFENN